MAYDIFQDQHQGQKKEMLLYNISSGIQLLLNKCEENINKKGRNLNKGNRMIMQLLQLQLHVCWH